MSSAEIPAKKYRIKYFSNFCTTQKCKAVAETIYETDKMPNYGPDKDIYVTVGEDFTHAIVLNGNFNPAALSRVPKENRIGLAYEPPLFLNITPQFAIDVRKNLGKYYIGDAAEILGPNFVNSFAYMWHMPPLRAPPVKQSNVLISIMVSEKRTAEGHKYRHQLVQAILMYALPIDIYGRGSSMYGGGSGGNLRARKLGMVLDEAQETTASRHVKGTFKETEPYLGYHFHIAIENFRTPHYFSEKIINPLLCGTTPIYWGCENIDEYFPNTVIKLSGTIESDIALILQILQNPEKFRTYVDVDAVKRRTNLLQNLDTVFGGDETNTI